jgi:hypothetical protein
MSKKRSHFRSMRAKGLSPLAFRLLTTALERFACVPERALTRRQINDFGHGNAALEALVRQGYATKLLSTKTLYVFTGRPKR